MKKKLVVYRGKKLRLEWFFDDRGKSVSLEYYAQLTIDRKKKIAHLFTLLGDNGKIFNEEKFRNEGDQIYALKTSTDRFLCFFFYEAKVIITNGYEKKAKKIPTREKRRALKIKANYIKRCNDGDYYD